jgi:hypothetical protein
LPSSACREAADEITRLTAERDALVKERGEARDVLAEAVAALTAGLDLISPEKGWGTYGRMDSPELYTEALAFEDRASETLTKLKERQP